MTLTKQFFSLLVLVSFIPASHAAFPPEFTATYELNKFGLDAAAATLSLSKQGDGNWRYHSDTKPKGLIAIFRSDHITETTVLQQSGSQIRPLQYEYIHRGSKKNRDMKFRFNWDNKISDNLVKGHASTTPITENTIDKFSLQLRIMHDLMSGKKELKYEILDKGQIRDYEFEILGEEKVETPTGDYQCIKFKRERDNGERTTIMWAAKSLYYLPVKIQHIEEDGADFTLLLQSVSGKITESKTTKPAQ